MACGLLDQESTESLRREPSQESVPEIVESEALGDGGTLRHRGRGGLGVLIANH